MPRSRFISSSSAQLEGGGWQQRRWLVWSVSLALLVCGVQLALAGSAAAGTLVYWGNETGNTVSLSNPGSASSTIVVPASDDIYAPYAGVFDSAGNLYLASYDTGKIFKVTPAGVVSTFASGLGNPDALAIDSAGNLFVADDSSGAITKVTPAGVSSTFVPSSAGLESPDALTFDTSGNLYVANAGSGSGDGWISVVTPGGSVSTFIANPGYFVPSGLAFNASGTLFISEAIEGSIVSWANNTLSNFILGGTDLDGPIGIAFDDAGNLDVANNGNGEIDQINPEAVLSPIATGQGAPTFVAVVESPKAAGAPTASGAGIVGSPLTCHATWAPEPIGGTLFDQPVSTAVSWQVDGTTIPGATGSSYTPPVAGSYACTTTGTNQAGSTTQTSAAVPVIAVVAPETPLTPQTPSNAFSVVSEKVSKTGAIALGVQTHAPGSISAIATFTETIKRTTGEGKHRETHTTHKTITYGSAEATSNGITVADLAIKPTGNAAKLLKKLKTLHPKIKVSFLPTGGSQNDVVMSATVKAPKAKQSKHKG